MKICIIIPAYNEAKSIADIVKSLKTYSLDVVVIDDGSVDNTADRAKEAGAIVLSHVKNEGKGRGLKTGFDYCLKFDYDAVITMDGDGQHRPEEAMNFIEKFKATNAALIIGNRMHNPKNMPIVRYLTNIFTSKVISKVTGSEIRDSQCGFRLIRMDILRGLRLVTNRYDLESELLLEIARMNCKIETVSISSIYSGQISQINPLIDTYRFLRLIIRNSLERRRKEV